MPDTHIALLRGVNLGAHKRIPMAAFRELLADLGYHEVGTHLQSGNAVFISEKDAPTVRLEIESALRARLGVAADVILRSPERLAAAVAADPLREIATNPARHLLGFLDGVPDPAALAAVRAGIDDPAADGSRFAADADHLYLWCPKGVSKSPYFMVKWDRLGVSSTMRNWNTITALLSMAAERAG